MAHASSSGALQDPGGHSSLPSSRQRHGLRQSPAAFAARALAERKPSQSSVAPRAFFNGKHLFDAEDTTLQEAGDVGVWTKADSVTLFDDFEYGP